MSKPSKRRGSPFDAAAREYFAALIRIHGIRGASESSSVPVSKSTLGKIAKEYCIELRVGRRTYASMPLPRPRLDSNQVKRLTAMLNRGPKKAGYRTNSWTARPDLRNGPAQLGCEVPAAPFEGDACGSVAGPG